MYTSSNVITLYPFSYTLTLALLYYLFGADLSFFVNHLFRKRHLTHCICINAHQAMSGVISLSYLSLSMALTPSGAFLLFTGISALSVLFYGLIVPETHGRTLEEIESEIYRNVHAGHPPAVDVHISERHKNVHTLPYGSRLASSASSGHIYTLVAEDDNHEASYIYAEDASDRHLDYRIQTETELQ